MNEQVVVVGSGFAGSIMARLFAENGSDVTVVERRSHIAGNMYDFVDDNGIRVQKYGPHTFHTNNERTYEFLTKYCELAAYRLKCAAVINGVETPSPFNFKTIDQFYPAEKAEHLKQKLLDYYKADSATVLEMLNCEDKEIRDYAQFLFEKDYSLYTAKQWGKRPEEIDPSVLRRVPIVFNYNDTYFNDKYEGVPAEGFTALFENLLNHKNIKVQLDTDALEHIQFAENSSKVLYDGKEILLVYTGAIDELFGYSFGNLPYRSLYFEYETYSQKNYQNTAIVAHPADAPYTRITEYTKLPYQDVGEKTVIAKEYSVLYDAKNEKGNEPYYPVLTEESKAMYEKYLAYAKKYSNLILCGRLADFKYYNMDQVIERTLVLFDEIGHI